MKVHVAWSPRGQSERSEAHLCACVSPEGSTVLFVGRESPALENLAAEVQRMPLLRSYLFAHRIRTTELRQIVGEVHSPSGEPPSEELIKRALDVILLTEEPPGNEFPDATLPLPEETFDVVCEGTCWPGYDRSSLAPDGDVVADHVVMGSVFPPATP